MPLYPLTKMIPLRWPFYMSALVAALFQVFITLNAVSYEAKYFPPFATACAITAILTALWIAILLCYGCSEVEYKHLLTRCSTHITSFGVIAVLWFGIGVFLAIHANIKCHHHSPVCMPLWFSTLLAFLVFLFSCLCVAIVICPIAITGIGYNTHVEHARERARESHIDRTLDRQQRGNGGASID